MNQLPKFGTHVVVKSGNRRIGMTGTIRNKKMDTSGGDMWLIDFGTSGEGFFYLRHLDVASVISEIS